MRSVKIERNPAAERRAARVRTASKPRSVRAGAPARRGNGRGKDEPGLFGRLLARLGGHFSRPMLLLAASIILLALIGGLLVSGVVGRTWHRGEDAVSAVVADAGFGVYEIRITGNRRVPTSTLFAALGLRPGQSIFFVDLPAARARIMALDWIQSADVVRRYPDAVSVTVVEKRPFALWQTPAGAPGGARIAVVDRAGGIITARDVEKFVRLPKLIGAGAPETAADLVDAVMNQRAVSARTAAYERVSNRRWNLILNDGVVVELPETGWRTQLGALEKLIVEKGILERDVTEIDLRSPSQYFFILKSGEKKNVDRGKET